MEFIDDNTVYDVAVDRYELKDLPEIEYRVETVSSLDRMEEVVRETGSCLCDSDDMESYLEIFLDSEDVHFYDIGGEGYARSVEMETEQGEALAVDAVKTADSFDPKVFRAGVNSIFRHAEALRKDLVVGGNNFFMNGPGGVIDLSYEKDNRMAPATVTFFGEVVAEEELGLEDVKDFDKGEPWDGQELYFVRRL